MLFRKSCEVNHIVLTMINFSVPRIKSELGKFVIIPQSKALSLLIKLKLLIMPKNWLTLSKVILKEHLYSLHMYMFLASVCKSKH